MARFTPVGRVHGLQYKITFKVKGTVVNRKTGQAINMPERLAGAIAERMQAAAADHLHKNIKRRAASTGRLEAAIRSPKNREVRNGKLRVMLPEWLNTEVVDEEGRPYWRAIDQGSSKAVGRRIAGVFVTGGDPSPLRGSGQNQRFLGPRQFGTGHAGEKGRKLLADSGFKGSDLRTLFRISRPIRAVRFSQKARDAFTLPENAAKQIFKEIRSEVIVRRT
jgi:hypothetical protein